MRYGRIALLLVVVLMFAMVSGAIPASAQDLGAIGDSAAPPQISRGPEGFSVAALTPTFSQKWGSYGVGDYQFLETWHVGVDKNEYVYVADWGHNVVKKYTTTGVFVRSWGSTGSASGQFNGPRCAVADRQGYIWVADGDNDRIQKYNSIGAHIGTYSAVGLDAPTGICADEDFIYVTSEFAGKVFKFRTSGSYVSTIGTLGAGPGQLRNPAGVALDSHGNLYVTEFNNHRVSVFNPDTGAFIRSFGTAGTLPGQFMSPIGIGIDGLDRVWVSEGLGNRVQVLTSSGVPITAFGSTGAGDTQFAYAFGMALNAQGIFTSELTNRRVKKYTYGEAKTTERVGGYDRYEVAVNLAKKRFPGYAGMRHVIVVCGEDRAMADPLGAAQIAGLYDAPVLLTQSSVLNNRTKSALQSMRAASGPLAIHVIGGTVSVTPSTYNQIKATNSGGTIERISAADRYALSAAIAKRAKSLLASQGRTTPSVLLFNGENPAAFYDALAASPLSAKSGAVMMAIRKDSVPAAVAGALGSDFAGRTRYVVNSDAFVSAVNYGFLAAAGRLTTSSERTAAARAIADWGFSRGYIKYSNAGLANKLPDALTGGSYIGMLDGALLYTAADSLAAHSGTAADVHDDDIFKGWVFGGTTSVKDAVKTSFNTKIQ